MKRIFTIALIPYLFSCILYNTYFFDVYFCALLILLLLSFIKRKFRGYSIIAFSFSVLALLISSNAYSLSQKSFYPIVDKPITLKCVVYDTPCFSEYGISFTAKMHSAKIGNDILYLQEKTSVFCEGTEISDGIAYGDIIEFKTKLSLPSEAENDGAFSYQQYLNSHAIFTCCRTSDFAVTNLGKYENINPLLNAIYTLRNTLIKKCDTFFNGDISAFLKAILLGYRSDLSDDVQSNISRSGISHVISVSGMHLSILMVLLNFFIGKLKGKFKFFIIPVLNILFASFVTVITGFSPSVNRAALMLIISSLTSFFYREPDSLQSLSLAVLILILINPCAIYDVGLVLSAVSVLGIVLLNQKFNHLFRFIKNKTIRETFSVTMSAQIITLPVNVFCFNSVSLLSILTNMIILPFIPLLMGLGVMFLICPFNAITEFISGGIWIMVIVILNITKVIASIPLSHIEITFLQFIRFSVVCAILTVTVFLVLKFKSEIKRSICFLVSSVLITALIFASPQTGLSLTAINTPAGDCTLLQLKNGTSVLVDCGASYNYNQNMEDIHDYLIKNGISQLDYCVISSLNGNTVNNLLNLAKKFQIKCIIAPDYLTSENALTTKKAFEELSTLAVPLYFMKKGDSFTLDDNVTFHVLLPDNQIDYPRENVNNVNMVFSVSFASRKILFTGNIQAFEKQLLTNSNDDIKADIIKLPDKGRHVWNDSEFLQKVNPSFAYAFTGENALPHDTEEIISDLEIKTFTTHTDKTIKMNISENGEIVIR